MSSYNPNIPVNTDLMLKSQFQIKANFQAINSVWAQNHRKLNDPQQGQHNLLLFRPQPADPTTLADQVALYTKLVTGTPQIFFRPQNNATPIQMTYSSLSTGLQSTNPDVYLPTQYSFMAGPFVVYGGLIKAANNNQTVTLIPSTTLIYVGLTTQNLEATIGGKKYVQNDRVEPTNVSGNSFKIIFSSGTGSVFTSQNVYYLAIGI